MSDDFVSHDEAKSKVCHMTLAGTYGTPGKCKAEACMAWRSAGARRGRELERRVAEPQSTNPGMGSMALWYYEPPERDEPAHWIHYESTQIGFCGLIGEPS